MPGNTIGNPEMTRIDLTFSRAFSTKVDPTENVKACAAMFGLGVDEEINLVLYQDLKLRFGRGTITYITGDSGAGKSCLLRDISARLMSRQDCHIFLMGDDFPTKPLIDQFPGWSLQAIGELLASVGISEPFVYLRSPNQLSDGQKYRYALACMIYGALTRAAGKLPVICIDEFLAFLDRETARNVAYQVRRAATKHGLCVIVATTHADIAKDLQANATVTMRLAVPPELKRKPFASAAP